MTPPGKQAANPFQKTLSQAGPQTGVSRNGTTFPGGRPIRQSRYQRGISAVGTENRLPQLSMKQAAALSVGLHLASPVILTALVLLTLLLLSWLLHFNFWDLFKVREKPADIEFTLVDDRQEARPEKPRFKGNFNQRAGGKTDPMQPLKAVSEPPQASAAAVTPPQPQQPQPAPQKMPSPPETQPVAVQKPMFKPLIPLPSRENTKAVSGPVVKTATPSQNASVAPVQVASTSGASGNPGMAGSGNSSSLSNPQDGPGLSPGVDVEQDVDFGPFMADLERRIKRNWMPPRGNENRRVTLLFYLSRDGRVMKVETSKSSGEEDADQAAIAAVQASAPFMPFPPQVKEDILPVEFTFDYNVLKPKNGKRP